MIPSSKQYRDWANNWCDLCEALDLAPEATAQGVVTRFRVMEAELTRLRGVAVSLVQRNAQVQDLLEENAALRARCNRLLALNASFTAQ